MFPRDGKNWTILRAKYANLVQMIMVRNVISVVLSPAATVLQRLCLWQRVLANWFSVDSIAWIEIRLGWKLFSEKIDQTEDTVTT